MATAAQDRAFRLQEVVEWFESLTGDVTVPLADAKQLAADLRAITSPVQITRYEGAKHSAGPWLAAARPSSIVGWPVVAPGGRMICDVAIGHKPPNVSDGEWSAHYVEVEANAHLIAGAPALAAALERLVYVIDAAGLINLANGVQLGQISWFVKASDALADARSALSALEASVSVASQGVES